MYRAASVLTLCAALLYSGPQAVHQSSASDLASTEQSLADVVKTSPTARNWERLGLIRHLRSEYDSAIPAFREAVHLDPQLWTSQLFLGICLYRTNQFVTALKSLQTADRLVPPKDATGRDELDFWLGATQIALKKPLQGMATLERLLQRNPRHVDALELTVRTANDVATGAWNRVAETAFDTAPGYEVHGQALESEGNRAAALAAFRRSKALSPQRPGPGLSIGRLLLLDGKPNDALEILQLELKLPDCDPTAYFYAGLAAIQAGRYKDAAPWLEHASAWPARNPEAPLALAQVYLAIGKPEQAVNAARKAVEWMPSSTAAHDLLLSALSNAGRNADADIEQQRWTQQRH